MQKTFKLIKSRTKALQKCQDSQNYAKNPTWNVMLQLRVVSKVVVKIFVNICLAKTKLHLHSIVY